MGDMNICDLLVSAVVSPDAAVRLEVIFAADYPNMVPDFNVVPLCSQFGFLLFFLFLKIFCFQNRNPVCGLGRVLGSVLDELSIIWFVNPLFLSVPICSFHTRQARQSSTFRSNQTFFSRMGKVASKNIAG